MMRAAALAITLVLMPACGQSNHRASPAPRLQFERAAADAAGHGARLSRVLGCAGCHGADLTGQPWDEDPAIAISFSSNLTRAVPAYSDAMLERAIRYGVRADGSQLWGMPSELFTHLDPADMAALIAHLRRIRPAGVVHPRIRFGPRGREQVARGEYRSASRLVREQRNVWPVRLDRKHDRARYMVRATCAECHGVELRGQNGTPDLIVASAYSRDEFRHLMKTGESVTRRDLGLMAQVARSRFSHLTEGEADAIYDYLLARANVPQ